MISITEYDGSGRILCNRGFSDEETYELNNQNPHILGEYRGDEYYVADGEAVERPASPVTLSDLTLLGVPTGSTLWINGERFENVEGAVDLEFPLSGTYSLRVECFPYKDWEGEVSV